MDRFIINGGNPLYGIPEISAAKNSALPILAASVALCGKTHIKNCPEICDVAVMADIIENMGGKTVFRSNELTIDAIGLKTWRLPCELTKKIRASLFIVGALLTRFGAAEICRAGGCDIGDRPIDIHIDALRALGADVEEGETVKFKKKKTGGGKVKLRYPSVGATENAMLYAAGLKGESVIENAAKEPEIVDLQNFLNLLGVKVSGAGGERITVCGDGRRETGEVYFEPSKDRIEAGTFLLAGAICGGEMQFETRDLCNLTAVSKILSNNACKIRPKNDKIVCVEYCGLKKGFGKVVVSPYPGFPTDLQPQLVAAASFARGVTVVEETVFPKRFNYVEELLKTGADISVGGNLCAVNGKAGLVGASMVAGDLRGGAALALAALGADGRSQILGVNHIDRGYFAFEKKLRALGADVSRVSV